MQTSLNKASNRGPRRASHILLKHASSDDPLSARTSLQVPLSRGEAFEEMSTICQELGTNNFYDIAYTRSDCSSYKVGGDLGWFAPEDVKPEFEAAVNLLEVGHISCIVETQSGWHVILRTA